MKKVFVSMPMRGLTDDEVIAGMFQNIEQAEQQLGEEIEVIRSILDLGTGAKPLEYLAKSLTLMARADVVVFAKGWQETRGCSIEHDCAVAYGYDVVYLD